MKRKLQLLLLILIFVSVACYLVSSLVRTKETGDKLKQTIVTSFYPVYIAALNIVDGVDGVELLNLTDYQTGCLHDYQLTTLDMKKLDAASLFLINGGGAETFLDEIVAVYPNLMVAEASDGIRMLQSEEGHSHAEEVQLPIHMEVEGDAEEDSKEHYNAHVWMNTKKYIKQIQNIADALSDFDEAHKWEYQKNAERYISKISLLEDKMRKELASPVNKDIVIFHNSFAYLAEELSLDIIYEVELESDSVFSAGELRHIIEEINLHKVKVLFSEEQYSGSIPKNIAAETNATVCILDSLVSGEADKNAYLDGMYRNLETLKRALFE